MLCDGAISRVLHAQDPGHRQREGIGGGNRGEVDEGTSIDRSVRQFFNHLQRKSGLAYTSRIGQSDEVDTLQQEQPDCRRDLPFPANKRGQRSRTGRSEGPPRE